MADEIRRAPMLPRFPLFPKAAVRQSERGEWFACPYGLDDQGGQIGPYASAAAAWDFIAQIKASQVTAHDGPPPDTTNDAVAITEAMRPEYAKGYEDGYADGERNRPPRF